MNHIETDVTHDWSSIHQYFRYISKIRIPVSNGQRYIKPRDIVFFESRPTGTDIHLINGLTLSTIKTIKAVLELLPEKHFVRVHKSFVVNVNFLVYYNSKEKVCLLEAKTGKFEIPVSLRMIKNLLF